MRMALRISLLGLLALSFGAPARAQVRDARVISAQAGGVNFVSGKVEFNREGAADWRALTDGVELGSGDVVRAGAGGRVEVLLNPGSYLRAGDGAEFELADDSLDDLRLKVLRGSAVVEATGYSDADLSILVETPHARVRIVRSGIYRFNVLPSGLTEVGVQKGRVLVGADEMLVKGGRVVRAGGAGQPEVAKAKFEKKDRDALDLWSRERGKELAKVNEKVSARQVVNALSTYDHTFARRLNGVWFFDPRRGYYTFLPFYASWRSPYGPFYWNQLWAPRGPQCFGCADPRGPQVFTGGTPGHPSGGGNSGGGGASAPSRPSPPARDFPRASPGGRIGSPMPARGRELP